MTESAIIAFCSLLLVAYVFHLTSSKTKIPSVILLLLVGWLIKQATIIFEYDMPDLSFILPVLGTIGLILIVLEGSFELDLNKSKLKVIRKSFFGALFPIFILAFGLSYLFQYLGYFSFKDSIINAIPLCVISSAIAIPSVQNLSSDKKEFVIYESSLSDIIGVIFFNFIAFNEIFDGQAFGNFAIQLGVIIVVSFVATILLSLLLSKIKNHIKFMPIIILIILVYAIAKLYHLPALVFILIFGLFIGNLSKLFKFKWIERFHPEALSREIDQFKMLTMEATFVVRSLFFLVFGFLIETEEIINSDTFIWAGGIVFAIYLIRAVQLKFSKLPLSPLLFVAPRGLITILLYLSIDPVHYIPYVNRSLIIQIILLSAFIMMFGCMFSKEKKEIAEEENNASEEVKAIETSEVADETLTAENAQENTENY